MSTTVPTVKQPFNRRARREFVTSTTSFPDAVKTAVERTLASIPCVILTILLFSFLMSEFTGSDGPLELFYLFLKNEQGLEDLNPFERVLIKFSIKFTKFLIGYKSKIFAILGFTITPILRSNTSILTVYFLAIGMILGLRSISVYIYLLGAFVFWLHTQLNKPGHKALTILLTIVFVALFFAYGLKHDATPFMDGINPNPAVQSAGGNRVPSTTARPKAAN